MNDNEKRQLYMNLELKIAGKEISDEAAIMEYVELGCTREWAEITLRDIHSEMVKAESGLM